MARFSPHTCHCIIDIPENPYREAQGKFFEKCKTHNAPVQTFNHNRSFTKTTGETDEALAIRRQDEKKKPAFAKDPSFRP